MYLRHTQARGKDGELARHFLGPRADQPALFEDRRDLSHAQVRVGRVRLERGVGFGDVWLGWPVWHQKTERVKAHILVDDLAFCLWKTLEGWQQHAHLGSSPRPPLDELKRIQCVDVVLPLVDGPELPLRCVVQPQEALACLLDRDLPRRLRPPARPAECSGKLDP